MPSDRLPEDPVARILESGILDPAWVGLQLGRSFESAADAAEAYLAADGCTPHPLFAGPWIRGPHGTPLHGRDPLLWYLDDEDRRREVTPHPLVDPEVVRASHPDGDLGAWLAAAAPDTPLPSSPGLPSPTYGDYVASSRRALRAWRQGARFRNAPRTTTTPPEWSDAAAPVARRDVRVSVVMPVWNRAPVIRQAVASVQAQTHRDWELLVVDDGSDDDSLAVLTGLAHFDDRIVVVPRPHLGVSASRNAALERATGTYVAFLDSDNVWRSDFLAQMVDALEANDWAMAHAGLRARKDGDTYYRAFEGTYEHLLVGNHVDLNVLVVRRDVLTEVGGFDETLRRGVDYELVLRLARGHDLHLVPYVGVDYSDDQQEGPRISTSESMTWLSVIADRFLVDWSTAQTTSRDDAVVTVVMPARAGARATIRALTELGGQPDLDVVLVGVRLPRWQHVLLGSLAEAWGNVRLVALEVDRGLAVTLNAGIAVATGTRTVVLGGSVDAEQHAVRELAAILDDERIAIAQPVVVGPGDLIAHAGVVFGRDRCFPEPFLRDHSLSDVDRAGDIEIPAASGPVLALRTDDLVALGGLDPLYGDHLAETDLSLRATTDGRVVLLSAGTRFQARDRPRHRGTAWEYAVQLLARRHDEPPRGSDQAWAAAGFERVGHRSEVLGNPDLADPLARPTWLPQSLLRPLPRASVAEAAPGLRWTIDLPSWSGRSALGWGDFHYGNALAGALRRLGQHVSVDSRDARFRATRDLDDVILVLRGLDRVAPRPDAVNVQWVISHPDDVSADELRDFDLVYAASPFWAEGRSAARSRPVRTLLQATDPRLFHPGRAATGSTAPVLFVGNTRGVFRTAVQHAVTRGIAVEVHGRGWQGILDPAMLASEYVDNHELAVLYAGAGVVLNDHWADMRRAGFVSNRLMDAAASGARVISDSVPGVDLDALFHGLVRTFESASDLERLVRNADAHFPDDAERRRLAAVVAAEHSFDQRARTLLDDVVALLRR